MEWDKKTDFFLRQTIIFLFIHDRRNGISGQCLSYH